GPVHRVAADADAGRLAEPGGGGLRHRLVGERARARDDPDLAAAMDVARHDADLALVGRDDPGTVRPDEPRLGAFEDPLHADHVLHRDALGDADDERHLGVDGLEDGVGRERRRHVDDRGRGAGRGDSLADGVENRQVEMLRPALPGRDAADHLRAVGHRLLGMEGALRAGEALADDLRVLVDEDRHQAASLTAPTTFWAASARSSADLIGSPESASIFFPRSTLVPSRRTTRGTVRLTSRAAATMPSAMTSQRMMPPKMLTRIPSTLGSARMSLKAAV